ncbi:MAG: DegT/DnrJ/EryC1/StrS family aminotransferase [Mariprofundaceae bacterium]
MKKMNQNSDFIPFALPSIGEEEISEVVDSLRSGWVTTGPKVAKFEQAFARKVEAKHALAVNSATSGLHLALEAVGVTSGDKVLTTPYTFTATAEVIRYLGADPLFVDIDSTSLNLDIVKARIVLEQALTRGERVKAIMPVHFAGLPCEMDGITALAQEFNLKIIEDAAHAFPATYQGKTIGSIGDVSVFSFYATKTICTGEGGMITTDDDDLAKRIKVMRLHGINRDVWDRYSSDRPSWFYEVIEPGFKYNMTDMAAGMGIHQLAKADVFRERREWVSEAYSHAFKDLPVVLPATGELEGTHAWHLYVLRLCGEKLSISRDRFIEIMAEKGVGTSVHFIPLHIQPYWKKAYQLEPTDFPIALNAYKHAVSLPIYPGLTDEQVKKVIHVVEATLEEYAC